MWAFYSELTGTYYPSRYLLKKSIGELDLSIRAFNSLHNAGIHDVGTLVGKTPEELLRIKHIGPLTLTEIEDVLGEHGLELKQPEQPSVGRTSG